MTVIKREVEVAWYEVRHVVLPEFILESFDWLSRDGKLKITNFIPRDYRGGVMVGIFKSPFQTEIRLVPPTFGIVDSPLTFAVYPEINEKEEIIGWKWKILDPYRGEEEEN